MLALVESLVNGSDRARQDGKTWTLLLAAPLVIVACCIAGAAVAGLLHLAPGLRAALAEDAALAIAAAFICMVLALPALASGHRLPWLLPLWVGPSVGAAGWAVLPLPQGPLIRLAETVGLMLPVMVVYLAAACTGLPRGLVSAAAACGASPFRAMLHGILRPALPILLRGIALVFMLALGLTPLLPKTLVLAPVASNP